MKCGGETCDSPGAALTAAENPFASRFVRPGAVPYFFDNFPSLAAGIEWLIDRLAACAWRGAIVGPHGSGKSTLLECLAAELGRRGMDVWCVAADGGRHDECDLSAAHFWQESQSILFVDGFDALPRWRRWYLRWRYQRAACGLVVTGHGTVGQVSNLSGPRVDSNSKLSDVPVESPTPFEQVANPAYSGQVGNPSYSGRVGNPSYFGRVANPSYMGLPVLLRTCTSAALAERIAATLAGEAFARAARDSSRESFARHHGNLREVLFDLYDLYERQTRHERNDGRTRRSRVT